MNEALAGVLLKGLVQSQPEEKRKLYEYVVKIEDLLAQQAKTSEHFLSLLIEHTPHKRAAAHFGCSYPEVIQKMREIEAELDEELYAILKRAKWLDCTPVTRKQKKVKTKRTALYLFVI